MLSLNSVVDVYDQDTPVMRILLSRETLERNATDIPAGVMLSLCQRYPWADPPQQRVQLGDVLDVYEGDTPVMRILLTTETLDAIESLQAARERAQWARAFGPEQTRI